MTATADSPRGKGRAAGARRLPPWARWRPTSRRSVWRRVRARRWLTAVLVGLATWLVAGAALPQAPPQGARVVVVARDL
ncbi:hypothetical protein, partial [Segeticoccus rhizosphaerae]